MCCFSDEILLAGVAVPSRATNNKEFTGKSSLTSFCAESSEKKLGWSTIFHELKSDGKQRLLRIICRFLKKEITVNPGQDSIHELIIWKVNLFVASVTCSRYQITFKWSVKFWLQFLVNDEMDKCFNGWNFYLDIL